MPLTSGLDLSPGIHFPLTAQMTTPEDQRAFVFNPMLSRD